MPVISIKKDIRCSRSTLFSLLNDFRERLHWDCLVKNIEFDGNLVRSCTGMLSDGVSFSVFNLRLEHLALAPPALSLATMVQGPWFFSKYQCYWKLEAKSEQLTRVNVQCEFSLKYRWMRPLIAPSMNYILRRDLLRELECLQREAEGMQNLPDVEIRALADLRI